MKKLYLILLGITTVLTACKKDNDTPMPIDTDFATAFAGNYLGHFHDTYHYSGTSAQNYTDAYSNDTTYNSSLSLTRLNDTSLILHASVFSYITNELDTLILSSDTTFYDYYINSGGGFSWQLQLTKNSIPANNSVYLRYVSDPPPSGHSITVQEFTSYERIN